MYHNQSTGDMGGSGAAMDPLFWVAHGAVDRLFQKVLPTFFSLCTTILS